MRSTRRELLAVIASSGMIATSGCLGGFSGEDQPPERTVTPTEGTPIDSTTPTETPVPDSGPPTETPSPTETPEESDTPSSFPRQDPEEVNLTAADLPDTVAVKSPRPVEKITDITFVPETAVGYIGQRNGVVSVIFKGDIQDRVLLNLANKDHIITDATRGVLGVAAHPNIHSNLRFFVRYSAETTWEEPDEYSHKTVISEFPVNETGVRADPGEETVLLEILQATADHNGRGLTFGPDGYLYIPVGDGSGQFDVEGDRASDWYVDNEGGNGQDTSENLLGGLLRIDVGSGSGPLEEGYRIPDSNPLTNLEQHHSEYYAWGLRNPQNIWSDSVYGDIYVADTGVNWEAVYQGAGGGNYGWNVTDGSECFNASNPASPYDSCPGTTTASVRNGSETIRDPIVEYPTERNESHRSTAFTGTQIGGGAIYRGPRIPSLKGVMILVDKSDSSKILAAFPQETGWGIKEIGLSFQDGEPIHEQFFGVKADSQGEVGIYGKEGLYILAPQ